MARLLVARGPRVERLWHAAALGMTDRVGELLGSGPPATQGEIDHAFWQACHGGQRRVAELLLARGADINAIPDHTEHTPLDIAPGPDTRREAVVSWLRAAVFEERLDLALAGRAGPVVRRRVVADEREAAEAEMHGSPTLLIDGVDPFAQPGQAVGLSCRLYRDAAGHMAGAPSVAALRQALAAAGDG